jgi:hypothetical protein
VRGPSRCQIGRAGIVFGTGTEPEVGVVAAAELASDLREAYGHLVTFGNGRLEADTLTLRSILRPILTMKRAMAMDAIVCAW